MKMFVLMAVLLGSLIQVAHANETQALYFNGAKEGIVYKITYNAHGAVLRSSSDVIYLGKNCDAKSSKYGIGKWWWANGGWGIDFKGVQVASAAHAESPNISGRLDCT